MTDGYHSPMSGPARPYAFCLGLLLLASGPVWTARAAQADGASRTGATQSGWWNRLQGPAEGEPDGNPIRPLAPPVPKPPTVPADAIATSAGGGQVDKVAAVGIDLVLAPGDSVDGLVLRLHESPAGGANVGADKAKVTACPATAPWGPGQNAAWRERPPADCRLGSAAGVRADDGTWMFDLTAIARRWADPARPAAPDGVVLSVDPAGSPSPVQVSWLDVDSGHVAVDLATTPGPPTAAGADAGPVPPPEPATAAAPPAGTGAALSDTATDTRALAAPSGGVWRDPLGLATGQPTFAAKPAGPDAAGAPADPAAVALPDGPAPNRPVLPARRAVDFWEHVPGPTAVLFPITAGLAVLIGLVLGPAGRPAPVFRREGGLSRALARRQPGA